MSGPFEFARRVGAAVVHHHGPASLALTIADLATADGHSLSAGFNVAVKLHDRPADLQLFDEQFLVSHDAVSLNDLRQFLIGPLKTSLEIFAAQHEIAACFRQKETIQTLLLQRCNAIGFGCGLEFFPPIDLQLSSESLRLHQLKDRQQREQADAIDRSNRLAEKLDSLGRLDRLPAQEQSALLPAILQRAAATPRPVHIAAGDQLLTLDPFTLALQTVAVPPEIGLLRSVRSIRIGATHRTLAGGQRGLWMLPEGDLPQAIFLHTSSSSRGMNSACWFAQTGELVAAHGEVGLIAWTIEKPQRSRTIATPPDARWLTPLDERLVFAAATDVCVFDGSAVRVANAGNARVVALLPFEHDFWIVREDGGIERVDRSTLRSCGSYRNTTPIQSAAAITDAGLRIAILAGANGEVECVTASGDILLRLAKSLGSIRMLAVAGGHIVGVSSDRSSLIVWNGANPQNEPRALNILARTGHRIADIEA